MMMIQWKINWRTIFSSGRWFKMNNLRLRECICRYTVIELRLNSHWLTYCAIRQCLPLRSISFSSTATHCALFNFFFSSALRRYGPNYHSMIKEPFSFLDLLEWKKKKKSTHTHVSRYWIEKKKNTIETWIIIILNVKMMKLKNFFMTIKISNKIFFYLLK